MSNKNPFVKGLASNDPIVRNSAFETVLKFLASRETLGLSRLELEKLWKGLYFSMWFCDKPGPQQELAENIAKLYSESIPKKQFAAFLAAFWRIMAREWPSVDQWRIDKYYMLMRRVLRHSFIFLQNHKWDAGLIKKFLAVLQEGPLSGDKSTSVALPYHLCDIYLDELQLVMFLHLDNLQQELDNIQDQKSLEYLEAEEALCAAQREAAQDVPLKSLVSCFETLHDKARLGTLRDKCKQEVLDDERLARWQGTNGPANSSSESDDESEEEWKGF